MHISAESQRPNPQSPPFDSSFTPVQTRFNAVKEPLIINVDVQSEHDHMTTSSSIPHCLACALAFASLRSTVSFLSCYLGLFLAGCFRHR